jgi:hypothetical protein
MATGRHRQRRPQAPARDTAAAGRTPVVSRPALRAPAIAIQATAGNQAVQRSLANPVSAPSRRSVANPPAIRRLATKEEFKKQTSAGFLSGRGKTLKEIESLLDEYHALRARGLHLKPGGTQDRAINILYQVREDVNLWIDTHEGDTSRSRKRTPGMTALFIEAGKELAELIKIRDAAREFLGEDQKPIERTENKFKTQMEGDVSSILSKIGPIIGAAAPSSGDSAELEVEVKVPIEPSGVGYLGLRFKASVERLKKQALKVGFEVAFTGGANIPNIAEIGGELGMYVEAQGATPEKAMELVSYGMYRRIRESRVIPNEVANFIWGGSASAVGWKRAEKWAAKVEKENFKDKSLNLGGTGDSDEEDAYVETGGLAGARAKGGVGGWPTSKAASATSPVRSTTTSPSRSASRPASGRRRPSPRCAASPKCSAKAPTTWSWPSRRPVAPSPGASRSHSIGPPKAKDSEPPCSRSPSRSMPPPPSP